MLDYALRLDRLTLLSRQPAATSTLALGWVPEKHKKHEAYPHDGAGGPAVPHHDLPPSICFAASASRSVFGLPDAMGFFPFLASFSLPVVVVVLVCSCFEVCSELSTLA
jgi:hypothetical protein